MARLTQSDYRNLLKTHIVPFFGNMRVGEVTRQDVSAFYHSLRHTPFMANNCLHRLLKMLNHAETWGIEEETLYKGGEEG